MIPSPPSSPPAPLPTRAGATRVLDWQALRPPRESQAPHAYHAPHAYRVPFLIVVALTAVVSFTAAVSAQETSTLSGRVVDEASSSPIADVAVRVEGSKLQALTGADGAFLIENVPAGPHLLVLEHLAYGTHSQNVAVTAGEELRLSVRMSPRAIELAPLVVEGVSELQRRRVTTGHAMNEIPLAEIDDAARRGLDLSEVLRQRLPGLRITQGGRPGRASCVEYRTASAQGPCQEVSIYVDGVRAAVPSLLYFSMPLEDIARLELLSPLQASTRYGSAAGGGALLIETKRGPQPGRVVDPERLMTGFDWSLEEGRYEWTRVLLSSLIGSTVGLAIGLAVADACLDVDEGLGGLRPRCPGLATMGAGFLALSLPSATGSYSAHWAGETSRSRGRFLPSALAGTMMASAGYLLLIEGKEGGSGAVETAGIVILTVGTPIALAISDRVFRSLR